MCMLCDDEKAYRAYMEYLDAMERQGKVADPDKAMDAVLDALEAASEGARRGEARRSRPPTRRFLRFSVAPCRNPINDRSDIADA